MDVGKNNRKNYSKVPILRPPFGQSQMWSLIRGTQGVESKEKNYLNFVNKVFNGCVNFRWP